MTHFNGPIVKCSESEVVSTSTGLVASVTWPDLRYPCSLAGKNSSATVAQHLDGNRLRATWMKLVLSMVAGLSPGEFVLDGDPAPSPKRGREPFQI